MVEAKTEIQRELMLELGCVSHEAKQMQDCCMSVRHVDKKATVCKQFCSNYSMPLLVLVFVWMKG